MPTVNQSLEAFLQAQLPRHNGPDLLERVLRHLPALEIQVNVAAGSGEPVDGKRSTYTDGVNEWFNIRIPKNADSEPEWHDYELRWPLDLHVEGIGSTGWDWQAKRSRWVGFDVDSITNHAAGVGISDAELEAVKEAVQALPYVEVRRSTGGKGLHLYCHFDADGIPTANHTEHAALARCILGMMSSVTGFDFASQIDACGGNMWVWHRKMSKENSGLALVKAAGRAISTTDLPNNWRDHIEVVTRRRAKIRVAPLLTEHEDPFETLASSRRLVPLDETHKAIIEELGRSGFSTVWVPDYHLLQTHTKALESLIDAPEKRSALKLKGIFKTTSKGSDPATCNCFCFPLDNGAWRVYRFVARDTTGKWVEQPKDNIKNTLLFLGHAKPEAEMILGAACHQSWKLVSLPFQPEYPGDRQWNRDAAQYRYAPIEVGQTPHHPHWDMVLKHCFGDLDEAIRELPWANRANIKSGAEYGLLWAACMLRDPFQPLPYLFFYGDQNCGKSTYHEALELLMTKGMASADRAFKNQNDFNGELAGAILAYVEETDLSQAKGAYNKIKDWVTNPTLWIRRMRTDAYPLPNTLHFIQCANSPSACPIFPGDTRITMVYVPPLSPEDEIPREVLKERLRQEAPHFMRTLMDVTLPSIEGRLRLPVVDTHNKYRAQELCRDPLEQFIIENCYAVPGEKVLFSEFYERFQEWLMPEERHEWTRRKVSKSLPPNHPSGAHTDNKKFVGNLSWEPKQPEPNARPWIVINGRLRLK